MKVSEVAYLAGTTVRAVRWYHAVGLLPIPEGRPRDYGFDDLARLVRIRWLAESGMSLASIGHLLDGGPLPASTRKAMDAVYTFISLNKDNEDKNRGIPLEQHLDILKR